LPNLFSYVLSAADLDLDEPDSVAPRLQSSFKLIHEVCTFVVDCALKKWSSIGCNLWILVYFYYVLLIGIYLFFSLQVMHKVEVFYVLCLFLTGKHKLIVSQVKKTRNKKHLLIKYYCIVIGNYSSRKNCNSFFSIINIKILIILEL